jgi:Protein of unknown function (DUF3592)
MNVVRQTPNELIVHEGALKSVLVGVIFIAVGGGLITLRLANSSNWTGNTGAWLIYLVGGVLAAAGVWALVLSADRRFLFDRAAGTVTVVVQRLAHRTADVYALPDLQDVALERSAGSGQQSNSSFRLVFRTKAGGRVPWTPYSTMDEGALAACASAVRTFCGWGNASAPMSAPAPAAGSLSGHPVATNWGCVGIFLAIFVAVGIGLFASEVYRVYTWQPVTARVLSTDIKAVRGDKGTTYAPAVRYDYSFDEQRYQSDRVLPLSISASYGWAQRLRDRFRPGQIVTAYVNPNRPSSAFLVREVSLLPLVFVAFPLAIVGVLAWFARVQRRQLAAMQRYPVPVVDWAPG